MLIVSELSCDHLIGAVDILRVTGEGHPTEGAFTLAEEGPDIGLDETGEIEGVLNTRF
jgi:hypothetical protein